MRSLVAVVACLSFGCAGASLGTGTKLDVFDTGGYADATATEEKGMMVYAEGKGSMTLPNPDPNLPPLVFDMEEGGILEVCIGPCLRATARDQDAMGEALNTLANKIPDPPPVVP